MAERPSERVTPALLSQLTPNRQTIDDLEWVPLSLPASQLTARYLLDQLVSRTRP